MTLLLFAGGTQTALAVGTQSGLTISNQATVTYEVGLVPVPQTPILSDDLVTGAGPTTFVVDNLVDLTVVSQDALSIPVTPGANDQVLEFLVTNTGNTTQGYLLSVVNGALPLIPMANVRIYIDDPGGALPGAFDGADTLYGAATNAGDLDPNTLTPLVDAVMTVFIVADTPLTAVDATVNNYSLLAETTDVGTTDLLDDTVADDSTTVEVVFADGVGPEDPDQVDPDGTHSDSGSYTVGSATLSVTKTAVVDDGLGGTYAIPGATVTYTIVVANTGGSAATTVVITDAIPPETTLVLGSITLQIDALPATPVADGAPVSVTIPTLSGSSTATIVFQVLII